jgi:hypothetical protein
MPSWQCAIRGCGEEFPDAETVVVHQALEHGPHRCKVCNADISEGYFAIRHALEEHSRAEYVRAYDADADAIRERERVKSVVEAEVDVDRVVSQLEEEGGF